MYIGAKNDNLENKIGHNWFHCSKELYDMFKRLKKQERKIILIGGAENECILDIFICMKTIECNVSYNHELLYSNKGSKFQ